MSTRRSRRSPPRRPRIRGFTIGEFGDASVNKQLNESISDDFKQALFTSLPITLLILLIAFGALVAAGVPAAAGADRGDRRRSA